MNLAFFLMLLLAINFKNAKQQRYACTDGGCKMSEANCCSGIWCTPKTPCSVASPCYPSSYSVNVYLVCIRIFYSVGTGAGYSVKNGNFT